MYELFKAILLGIVEGVTEFLPVSSTGHLILFEKWLGVDLEADPFWKLFAIFIQIGAIAAVVVYFRERIAQLLRGGRGAGQDADTGEPQVSVSGSGSGAAAVLEPRVATRSLSEVLVRHHALLMIVVGSLPLGLAYLAHRWAEKNMESTVMVAGALGIGGVLMILIERFRPPVRTASIEQMNWRQALGIGMAQILAAIFPGTSRSAATIMGGEIAGLSRTAAAEFSFFLAIPAMSAACAFALFRHRASLDLWHGTLLAVGTVVSFFVAWAVIAAFMSFIRRHSFVPFAVYRIVLAVVVLAAMG